MADVTDSKSVGSDTVRVQVPLPAPKQKRKSIDLRFCFEAVECEEPANTEGV